MGVRSFPQFLKDPDASIFVGPKPILDAIIEVGGLAVLVWVAVWLVQHVRYWSNYENTYVLSADRIEVETPTERVRLTWEEIDHAEYMPLFGIARLTSHRLPKPIVLFLTRESEQAKERETFVRCILAEKLGARYRAAWL